MTEAPEKIEEGRWTKQCKKHKGEWWVEVVVVVVVNVAVVGCWLLVVVGCCWLLLVVVGWLLVGCWLLLVVVGWLLVVVGWLLVVGCCWLVVGCWLLVVGCWLCINQKRWHCLWWVNMPYLIIFVMYRLIFIRQFFVVHQNVWSTNGWLVIWDSRDTPK